MELEEDESETEMRLDLHLALPPQIERGVDFARGTSIKSAII